MKQPHIYAHLIYIDRGDKRSYCFSTPPWTCPISSVFPIDNAGTENYPYGNSETEPIPHTIHKNKFHLAGNQVQSNNHMKYFTVKKKCTDYIFLWDTS